MNVFLLYMFLITASTDPKVTYIREMSKSGGVTRLCHSEATEGTFEQNVNCELSCVQREVPSERESSLLLSRCLPSSGR